MPEFNPNEMDALFREGAERHEFVYDENAWALMEEKLDRRQRKRRIIFFLLAGLVLAASFLAFLQLENTELDRSKLEETLTNSSPSIAEGIKEPLTPTSKESNIEVEGITIEKEASEKNYMSTDSKESSSNIGAQNSFHSENTGNLVRNEIVSVSSQEGDDDDLLLEETTNLVSTLVAEMEKENPRQPTPKVEAIVIPFLKSPDLARLLIPVVEIEDPQISIERNDMDSNVSLSNNGFALTLFANPEWSSVGLFEESKAGWSFGIKAGYQFADKFEISTGLIYSRKIYKGGGEAYTMPGGWYDDVEPMRIDAKCDVFEIPIALSFYTQGYRNSGFFADIGINSYMLHSEWYGFEYNDALLRPDRYTEVTEEDQNKHLIGVGRVAIGYQKVLSQSTTLQVAPYLQFPLTGIGAGQVNVYSSGVQLAVKFNTQ